MQGVGRYSDFGGRLFVEYDDNTYIFNTYQYMSHSFLLLLGAFSEPRQSYSTFYSYPPITLDLLEYLDARALRIIS